MYATSFTSEVYHLLKHGEYRTLCGQPVVPIVIKREAESSILYLIPEQPANGQLCDECKKQQERSGTRQR